ncbi:MAG: hypothetical protein AAGC96_16235 [Pseudomonadota bacterium]
MQILDRHVVNRAKRAFSTRRVPAGDIKTLVTPMRAPKVGDLVMARVAELGSHKKLELPSGRRATMNAGDEIIVVYGERYAPDQYEAYVPQDMGPCDLVAAGGIAARTESWHQRMIGPTRIEPIGLLGCAGHEPLNIMSYAVERSQDAMPDVVFAVFGTSMNSGKTTTAAALIRGFSDAGHRVGGIKITGTAAGGDLWLMRDNGAVAVLDFTDAGYPSTFNIDPNDLWAGAENLLRTLGARGCNIAVIEIADGLLQGETASLASMESLRSLFTGVFFASGDAMGAVAGAASLASQGHRVLGISGALTRSPLASRETRCATPYPVLDLVGLRHPDAIREWAGLASSDLATASGQ